MVMFLSESDVKAAIGMPETVEVLEAAFAESSRGGVVVLPRVGQLLPGTAGAFRIIAAALPERGFFGLKSLTGLPGKRLADEVYFSTMLFDMHSGALRAIISSNYLTGLRTGAASGVAAKFLARKDADSIGILGSGVQAWFQVEALCSARKVKTIKVFSRDASRAALFTDEIQKRLGIFAKAVSSAREAVRGSSMVVTATSSSTPVLEGSWLEPGVHVSAIGASMRTKSELDIACFERGSIFADSREQVLEEGGDLRAAIASGRIGTDVIEAELSDLAGHLKPGRQSDEEITIYKSVGGALQDIALASSIFQIAKQNGLGVLLDAFSLSSSSA